MLEAINQLMYYFSHLKTTEHLDWVTIVLTIILNIFVIWLFLKFDEKEDAKMWIISLVLANIILIPVFKDVYTYETVNNPPVTQFNKTKAEVAKDYPYCLQLTNEDSNDNYHSYLLFFKNAQAAQSTLTTLNAAANNDNDNASVILTPDKNIVVMSCSTKMINTHALSYTLIVKDYKSLTKSKVVKVDNAQYALQPTKNLKLY